MPRKDLKKLLSTPLNQLTDVESEVVHKYAQAKVREEINKLAPLKWITYLENAEHSRINGGALTGIRHKAAKLSLVDIQKIFELHGKGLSTNKIGRVFKVKGTIIGRLVRGLSYKKELMHLLDNGLIVPTKFQQSKDLL